ncbi:MAG: peptidyl-prolyl cis-trans isomerase [Pseudomonadales bacterium]|nr:peptidyl-prolyl cis-trans isomerase [Pseudomonadales bacterium]
MLLVFKRLIGFFIIGATIYFTELWLAPNQPNIIGQIEVTASDITNIKTSFFNSTKRMPSALELAKLVAGKVDEKILLAEALRLGIHRHDLVIKQRLSKNLSFAELLDSNYRLGVGSELLNQSMLEKDLVVQRRLLERMKALLKSEEGGSLQDLSVLEAYYQANQQLYLKPRQFRIQHRYVSQQASSEKQLSDEDISKGLVLFSPEDPVSDANLRKLLPVELVKGISDSHSTGELDPYQTANGTHFVTILEILEKQPLTYAQALPKVKQDFLKSLEKRVIAQYLDQVRVHYEVTIYE